MHKCNSPYIQALVFGGRFKHHMQHNPNADVQFISCILPADVRVLIDLLCCFDVADWVVARLAMCLQQHEVFN